MPERTVIATQQDIAELERRGLSGFLVADSPVGLIRRSAALWPDRVALRYLRDAGDPTRDEAITYRDLLYRINGAARLFRRLGVGPDDSVAILAPHVASSQIALWAAQLAGRACPINPMLRPDHIVSLLESCRAKVAVVLGRNSELPLWDRIVPGLRSAGVVSCILDLDADEPTIGSDGALETLAAADAADALGWEPEGDAHSIAALFHTGGTTGAPKMAQHSRLNQAFVAQSAALMFDLGREDVVVNGFPLFHVAGSIVYGLSALAAGASILIPTRLGMRNRRFVEAIWKAVETYRISVIGGVPTVISALNAVPVDADISSLRVMLTGGSPLPTELADSFERAVGRPVRNILGMTECAGIVSIEPLHGVRTPGSTGLRLPFTEVAAFRRSAIGVDLGARCGPDETGVIALRGPNVSPGYADAARNPGTFEADGWLISGDLGHVDAAGRLFVTGRAKDVIIRGAHNIDPGLIEDALLQHPAVALAAAVGQPDSYAGELPVAYVVLKPGAAATGDELLAFVSPLVAEPAARPGYVEILDDMPLTPVGKIYKPTLRVRATARGMARALEAAGFAPRDYDLSVAEAGATVAIEDEGRRQIARNALRGMPVAYDVVPRPPPPE